MPTTEAQKRATKNTKAKRVAEGGKHVSLVLRPAAAHALAELKQRGLSGQEAIELGLARLLAEPT